MNQQKELENYLLAHTDAEDELLRELDRETHLNVLSARMLSGHLQGKLLTMLAHMIRPNRILELGTFTGYSAICLAKALGGNGKLITIEQNDELRAISSKYFKKAGIESQIQALVGQATEIIPTLHEEFDLVFIDADKREYPDYYKLVFPKVKPGGYILADNTLWSGKVLTTPHADDFQTKGIKAFNALVKNDNRVEKVILPWRDGLTLIRKKRIM